MAVYRLEAKVISRAKGRSATASAAYRSASRIDDQRTGGTLDQPTQLRADAGEVGHRRKQRVEKRGAQVIGCPPFADAG